MRVRMTVAYDGSNFSGWQIQPRARTVQQELKHAFSRLYATELSVIGAGRTDSGVHARGQVIHLDVPHTRIPVARIPLAVGSLLPDDILTFDAQTAGEDFHAQRSARKRRYRYRFVCGRCFPDQRHHFGAFPHDFDRERMEDCMQVLSGRHDFTSFCLKDSAGKTRIRTIQRIASVQSPEGFDIVIEADGFLRKMVRMIIGSILVCYPEQKPARCLQAILEKKSNSYSGPPAEPGGLYLEKVEY